MPDALLSTIHGSRLYGLETPDSDFDTYEVVLHGRTHQWVDGLVDTTVVTLDDFTRQVETGVPQALEALWSPLRWTDPDWHSYFDALRPGHYETVDRYQRTIDNFWQRAERDHDLKVARHAFRLGLNLNAFMRWGHFNPRLGPEELQALKSVTPGNSGWV